MSGVDDFRASIGETVPRRASRSGTGSMPKTIAAEPIMGVGGLVVSPSGYLERVKDILDETSA